MTTLPRLLLGVALGRAALQIEREGQQSVPPPLGHGSDELARVAFGVPFFDKPRNNFIAAVGEHSSWGYFDFRMKDEGFDEGFQSVPVNWGISSERKKGFFRLVAEMTGSDAK